MAVTVPIAQVSSCLVANCHISHANYHRASHIIAQDFIVIVFLLMCLFFVNVISLHKMTVTCLSFC